MVTWQTRLRKLPEVIEWKLGPADAMGAMELQRSGI